MDKELKIQFDEIELPKNETIEIDDLWGLFSTVDTAPTHIPRKFSEQFVIYTNGATYRLYVYDSVNNAWRYATLT